MYKYNDPQMISEAALAEMYSDADVEAYLTSNETYAEHLAPTLVRLRAGDPEQVGPFMLAMRQAMYRTTGAYSKVCCDERMRTKPKPKPRPMAGYGSNSYRTWSR